MIKNFINAQGSYTNILVKDNVRIFVSDYTVIANELLKKHPEVTPFAKRIFGAAIATYGPLLFVITKSGSLHINLETDSVVSPIKLYLDQPGHIRANMDSFEIFTEYDKEGDVNSIPFILGLGDSGKIRVQTEINGKIFDSRVPLAAGDFITDLAYFFDQSWQVFTGIRMVSHVDKDHNLDKAYSVIMQLLPEHNKTDIDFVREFMQSYDFENNDADAVIEHLQAKSLTINPVDSQCVCDRDQKLASVKKALTQDEIEDHFKSNDVLEVKCPQCANLYTYLPRDFKDEEIH